VLLTNKSPDVPEAAAPIPSEPNCGLEVVVIPCTVLRAPDENVKELPTVALENPPDPLPYSNDVPDVAGA